MCGRVEYVMTNKQLEDHYDAKLIEGFTDQGIINARYNVPPASLNPVVMSENPEEISVGHWGYLPSWAKRGAKSREVINARAETIFEKPFFKSSIETRRCLIPITGFFEWKREEKIKTPYHFHMGGEIFSLAGVYTTIEDAMGVARPHYAIITTQANELMAPVHGRMPVIIKEGDETNWVSDSITDSEISKLFKPVPAELLQRDEISTMVNNPHNDSPNILIPVS